MYTNYADQQCQHDLKGSSLLHYLIVEFIQDPQELKAFVIPKQGDP